MNKQYHPHLSNLLGLQWGDFVHRPGIIERETQKPTKKHRPVIPKRPEDLKGLPMSYQPLECDGHPPAKTGRTHLDSLVLHLMSSFPWDPVVPVGSRKVFERRYSRPHP